MTTSPVANYYFRAAQRRMEITGDPSRPVPKKQWFDPDTVFEGPQTEFQAQTIDLNSMLAYANARTSISEE